MAKRTTVSTVEPKSKPAQVLNVEGLETLIDQAAETESVSRKLMEPASTVKRKRGRPSNAEKAEREASAPAPQPAQQVEALPPEPQVDCKPACDLIFKLMSASLVRYVGDSRMALQDSEIDQLGTVWGKVAEKYLPLFISNNAELFTALTVTGVVGVRIYSTAQELIIERQRQMHAERMRAEAKPDIPVQAEAAS